MFQYRQWRSWTVSRLLQLAFGAYLLISYFLGEADALAAATALFFIGMAWFNTGCLNNKC